MESYGETDRRLAWELHVELASRITAVELRPGEGLLVEVLNSLYSVFTTARKALAAHPPPGPRHEDSLHAVVIRLLNSGIRPFLTRWHPLLDAYREQRPAGVSEFEHETAWEHNAGFRAELAELQLVLRDVARHLAEIAGGTSLLAIAGGGR